MILLDTHIWIWWVHGDDRLTKDHTELLQLHEKTGLGVSVISCWEVAKLVEYQRLELPCSVDEWIKQALAYPYRSNATNCDRSNPITPTLSSRSSRSNYRCDRTYSWLSVNDIRWKNPQLSVRKNILNKPFFK